MTTTNPLSVPSKVPFVSSQVTNGRTGQTALVNDPAWLRFFQNLLNLIGDLTAGAQVGDTLLTISAPSANWLACNGAAVSRTTYAALYAAAGTVWGAGKGSTTFNLPTVNSPTTGLTYFIKAA